MQPFLLLWASALPLVLSPGPANLSLASFGVTYGFHRSLPYLTGVLVGTISVLLMVAMGVTAVFLTELAIVWVLKALAVAYILYLAWTIATAPIVGHAAEVSSVPSFWPGLGLALANPKAFSALGAVYAGHVVYEANLVADAVVKVSSLSLAIVISGLVWLSFGAAFSEVWRNPKVGRWINATFAFLLIVSVVPAVLM